MSEKGIDEISKDLWGNRPRSPFKEGSPAPSYRDLCENDMVANDYIVSLWNLIQRCQFRISELEHPEWQQNRV